MSSWRDWPSLLFTSPSERLSAPVERGQRHGSEYWKHTHTHSRGSISHKLHKNWAFRNGKNTPYCHVTYHPAYRKCDKILKRICLYGKQRESPVWSISSRIIIIIIMVLTHVHTVKTTSWCVVYVWRCGHVGCFVCVFCCVNMFSGLSVIILGDIPHMTNERDLGAWRGAHLSQVGG